jgi:hypothetical protein
MLETLAPPVTTRDPKGLKFVSIVEAAYNKAGLSEEEAQRVNDTPGLSELVGSFIAENRRNNRYANEEVRSNSAYPKGYAEPKPLGAQIDILAKIFNFSLGYTSEYIEKVLPRLTLPEGAEGWFAIPSIDALAARFFPDVKGQNERLCAASNLVLGKIGASRKFYNYRERELTPDRFRLNARTAHALDLLAEQQKGDIWVVGGQFGKRHAGRSVRRAREVMASSEFGGYTIAVGSMLLTHPERLISYNDLWMDLPGDEFDPAVDGSFGRAPYFRFDDGRVEFGTYWVSDANEDYGSVSLFLPQ